MKKLILLQLLFISIFGVSAQTKLDSLWAVWEDETQEDTTRLKALDVFALDGYMDTQADSAFYFAQMEYDFAKKKGLRKHMGKALISQGYSFRARGDYSNAIDYYQKSLTIREEIGDKMGIAQSLNNIGYIYYFQSNYTKALNYYQRSIAFSEEIGDKKTIAFSLRRIGQVYFVQSDFINALDYWQRALTTSEKIGDKKGIAQSLNNIGFLYINQSDYVKASNYYQRSLSIRKEIGDKGLIAASLGNIGTIYQSQGDYLKALDYYQRSLSIREEIGNKYGIAESLIEIGQIYNNQGDYVSALDYFQRCLTIYEEIGIKLGMASSLHNIGNIYRNQDDNVTALNYYQRSFTIYEEIGDKGGMAANLSSIGYIYSDQKDYVKAMDYQQRSLTLREETGDKKGIAGALISIGSVYHHQKAYLKGIAECKKSHLLAIEIGSLEEQKEACECLYDGYKALRDGNKALEYHEKMLVLNDSLKSEETAKKLQQMEFNKQLLQDSLAQAEEERLVQVAHQEEMRAEEKTKNISLGIGGLILLLAGGLFNRLRYVRKSKATLQVEKDRSENLLLNILPAEIAEELKSKGKADARDFEKVTILFTDFKGFTEASAKLSAQALVTEINTCFEAFDGIMDKYGIEKIKTIGDAYMAAGGLPMPTKDSVKNTILAALEMQKFITQRKTEKDAREEAAFEMRVGINTGSVVAGIVGVKKFQYDIWGDTVNTASRMESNGEVGKVNISQASYDLLKDDTNFIFEGRGKIKVKGKGKMGMYFVNLMQQLDGTDGS